MAEAVQDLKTKLVYALNKTSDAAQDYLEGLKSQEDRVGFVKLVELLQTISRIRDEIK